MLTGDHAAMAKFSEKDWMEIVAVTHAGMGTEDFEKLVADWLPKSENPALKRGPVTSLVYQPMLEVMDYLRANGFRTYIVTGGGQEFVRRLLRGRLRRPARAGGGLEHRDQVRDARTASRC